ncbi:unnamed protein product [Sphagnum jensenii]|uniref:Uncharacterized protein n=1 Tax=Sphagnum jensenii TaxID=128206 RepID=A0ABP0VVV0_9BRYO
MRSEFSGPTNSVPLPEDMKLEETLVVSAQEEEEEEEEKKKNVLVASSLQSENGNNVVAVINPKPAAYNLDEIASNLHETATKALEQAETARNGATAQASIVEDVAHLVLDQNNNNNNDDDASSSSRDYLVGVILKVADYAEQAGQSKAAALNEGDDIVVTSTSPNHVDQSSTGSVGLSTYLSLFVVWCISLCTSAVGTKDLPPPTLKLAAEEVSAVLHSAEPSKS